MMLRMYLYRLKIIARERELLFWSSLFPICLAFVFNLAFSNLGNANEFETIPIAIVSQDENSTFIKTAKEVNMNEDAKMFDVELTTENEAKEKVKEGKISGYIVDGENPELYFAKTGPDATITKSFVDSYIQKIKMYTVIGQKDPQKLAEFAEQSVKQNEYVKEVGRDGKKINLTVIYFYALLAMTCLYGSNFGIDEIINIQANQSSRGARVNVAPVHKLKLLFSNLLAAYTAQLACVFLALAFMKYGIHIDLGDRFDLVVLTCVVGSLCGLMFGAFLSAVISKNFKIVQTICSAVVLLLCFLSGLMVPQVKQLVADNVPWFTKVSPATLITDCFYYLFYYDSLKEYWFNIGCLAVITVVFASIVYMKTRREQYASL